MSPGVELFLVSFLSLFLELLLIRWVPSLVRMIAYYGNLMLLSSFLGLGCGALLCRRALGLYRWFPLPTLLLVVAVSAMEGVHFRQGPDELRFLFMPAGNTTALPVVLFFVLNALVFVPLGEIIGGYFERLPPLQAYSWDIGGAIAGTAAFGLFSFFWFSPIAGFVIAMALYFIYCRTIRHAVLTAIFFAATLTLVLLGSDPTAIWSPYNHLTVKRLDADGSRIAVSAPAKNNSVMQDPPFYRVEINRDFYMSVVAIDGRRYKKPGQNVVNFAAQYSFPHLIRPGAKDVLVVGSGGGVDVEAALLSGASRVDAVEIDPAIIQIGHQYNASQPYKDPRVSVHNTDARAFLRQTRQRYDMVVFALLDSQSLFSQMSNIRLDGYVYTRESFKEAFGLLREGGLLSISFHSAGKIWLLDRLVAMVRSATQAEPTLYLSSTGEVVVLAGRGFAPQGPEQIAGFRRVPWAGLGTPEALDDWPYLYLKQRFIPLDYLLTIGALLLVSFLFLRFSSDEKAKGIDPHFFFLGAGFLLLETKSITSVSLYFGTTWFVNMVVILGVLAMVFLANLAASRLAKPSLWLYLPLIASVGFLYSFPAERVLAWPFALRLAYSLAVIPLPIFFSGLIFSSTLRESPNPSCSLGSSLLGAMVGGFVEYLGMMTGMKALLLMVLLFYLASLWVRARSASTLTLYRWARSGA